MTEGIRREERLGKEWRRDFGKEGRKEVALGKEEEERLGKEGRSDVAQNIQRGRIKSNIFPQ